MHRIVVHGCYHTGNFGDLLLLDLMARHVQSRWETRLTCPWTGSIAKSEPTAAVSGTGWRDCMMAQAAIMGGGGYLNDGGGDRRAVRRLLRYSIPAKFWRLMRVPYIVVGVGAGPITSKLGARRIHSVCRGARHLCVRDRETADILIGLGIPATNIEVTADLVLMLQRENLPAEAVEAGQRLVGKRHVGEQRLALHFSSLGRDGSVIDRAARHVAEAIADAPQVRVFWIFDHGDAHADRIRQATDRYLPNATIIPHQSHWTTAALIGEMDAVITTKLHVGITAWALGVPTCGLSVHPKSKRFYAQIGRQAYQADIDSGTDIVNRWVGEMVNDPEAFAAERAGARVELPRLAKRNLEVVDAFLSEL